MLTVACALKSGGEYTAAHVHHLRDGVAKHLLQPHRFVCLSDVLTDCETIPLKHSWPGWWSKIELFRPALFFGPVVYVDLDTIITGSLDEIVHGHRFTMLENFWRPDRIGSGMMAWDADLSSIYDAFARSPRRFIEEYRTPEKWGDQAFIWKHAPFEPERWQKKYPGKVVSYKMHCRQGIDRTSPQPGNATVPAGASVVCFHGQPRPWSTSLWRS